MIKNSLASAGDTGSIPGPGRSPVPRETGPERHNGCTSAPEPVPHSPPPEAACMQQRRPSPAKNKLIKNSTGLSKLSALSTIFTISAKLPLNVGSADHTRACCLWVLSHLALTFGPFLMSHFFLPNLSITVFLILCY